MLVIDDIQWRDQDSIAALIGMLAPPSPPPVLMLLSARTDDDQGRAAQLIRDAFAEAGITVEDLPVQELDAEALGQLATQLDPDADPGKIASWCRDAGGSPLMLREIVAANRLGGAAGASLTDLLGLRLAALPPRERRLVEAVAIAGSPQPISTLSRVLSAPDDLIACAHRLDSARLLRWRGGVELGLHHDKIGETAISLLSPAHRRDSHVRFAEVLAEQGDAASDAVFEHWMAADRPERALGPGMQAAAHAERTFAFGRAAELFARLDALVDPGERPGLRRRQAEALANAGRGTAAARLYAGLAADPSVPDRSQLRRLAAFHFLRSGSVLDGLSNAREALAAAGERWIGHPGWAVARIIWARLGLRLRGYRFEERLDDPPLRVAERADALWSLSRALAPVDTLRAVELHLRHLPEILAHGDLPRVVRAIAWEAMLLSTESTSQRATAQALLGRAHMLADRLGRPRVLAEVVAARSYCARFDGHLDEALNLASSSIDIYRSRCQDIAWEIGSILVWCRFPALAWSGRLAELRRECDEAEREFEGYGDRYTLVTLRAGLLPWLLLAEGRPDDSARSIAAARADWTADGWHLQHLLAGLSSVRLALYRGDHVSALAEIAQIWPRMRSSGQVFNQWYHADALLLHGNAALRAGDHRLASRLARQLANVGHPWAKTHAAVMQAGAQAQAGDTNKQQRLREAAAAYDQAGLAMYAAAARLGADPADAAATAALTVMGVADPQRWTATLLPLH